MSRVNKCDRCGKITEGQYTSLRMCDVYYSSLDAYSRQAYFAIDLCPACQKELKKFYDWTDKGEATE